jgi:DNA modification methylase
MDAEYGLPSLQDKEYELCFTDFPYGVEYQGKQRHKEIKYEDYSNNHNLWFDTLEKKCEGLYIITGTINLYNQIIYRKPNYFPKFCYLPDADGYFHLDIYLCYGKIRNITKIVDVKKCKAHRWTDGHYLHTTPKPLDYFSYVLKRLLPSSVIDPFLGSGTTAEVCEKLGVKWLGYEINEVYSQDINKRLHNVKKEPKQVSLGVF